MRRSDSMNLLRRVPALLLAVTLALAVGIVPAPALLLAAPAAQAGEPALLDYYEGVMVIDGEDVTVGLLLYDDGTAEVISDFESEDGSIVQVTEVGTWVDNGDGTISLTVTGTTEGDYAAPVS